MAVVSIDCSCGILKTCHGSLKKFTMYWLRVIHNEFGPQACTDCNYCVLPGQYWALKNSPMYRVMLIHDELWP